MLCLPPLTSFSVLALVLCMDGQLSNEDGLVKAETYVGVEE
jgi:hypothetical protein